MSAKRLSYKPSGRKRRGVRWSMVLLVAGGLVVLAAVGAVLGTLGTKGKLRAALRLGQLADLPRAASNVHFDGLVRDGRAHYFVTFTASADDIDRFLRTSPGLRTVLAEPLGPQRMSVPRGTVLPTTTSSPAAPGAHVIYDPEPQFPWFAPNVQTQGRRFVITPGDLTGRGEIIVDDERHIVYIRVADG